MGGVAQLALVHVLSEEGLAAEQRGSVARGGGGEGPVVCEHDVDGGRCLWRRRGEGSE